MTLFEIIGTVLLGPLKQLFELIFSLAYDIIGNPGLSIIVLSLTMNTLVLPLYKRADAIQIEARDKENKLKPVMDHIKKTFSGDERMMILQTYYRQNDYNPLSVLSGSISLLLQIPFFMAAYQFLSSLDILSGVSFGPIADLSVPDGLWVIGGVTINALPFIMTFINVVSSSLYLKGFPLKTKIQLYGMSLFFLVFLYNSPAGLVFYWTLNNTYSLFKTLFYRIKHSSIYLNVLLAAGGAVLIYMKLFMGYRTLIMVLGLIAQLPWVIALLKKILPKAKEAKQPVKDSTAAFVSGALFLSVLVGLVIPATYIASSPQEYIDVLYFHNPVWYIVRTACLAVGTFVVWMGVFYWLANPAGKRNFARGVWVLSGVALVNYMFFGTKLGVLTPDLVYNNGLSFDRAEILLNFGVIAALAAAFWFISRKSMRSIVAVLLIGAIALSAMNVMNVAKVSKTAKETEIQLSNSTDKYPEFSLSKNGQNVVVIMIDTALGPFVPYIMEEKPELKEAFDGFTYYSNTLSYGGHTNFAAPALYGGYEYTPANINLRDTELLADKHDEALKVMPTLFSNEGYDVTLIDPSFAGYQWIPDLSVFDDMPGINTYLADGRYNDMESHIRNVTSRTRNFFLFSVMKVLPVYFQKTLYDGGDYLELSNGAEADDLSNVSSSFMNAYNVMKNLSTMTSFTSGTENNFMFLRSNITHDAALLQEPEFEPSSSVDNSAYYPEEGKTITYNGTSYLLDTEELISRYQINMTAMIQLANWFDYLRENDVYDNTRIIVVSDHGFRMGLFHDIMNDEHSIEYHTPTLLVKDFNAEGFTTSDEFMTNADVPHLAVEGLIENPVNPFTGKALDDSVKTENNVQYVTFSHHFDIGTNNGTQFFADDWAAVSGNVHDEENWTYYLGEYLLPPDMED